MPQFLYRLRPTRPDLLRTGPTPAEAATVVAHFAHLQALTQAGTVLMAGRTLTDDEHTQGLVVFEAPDVDAAQALMASDPAVAGGVMVAELWPFRVALWSSRGPGA